MRRGVRSAGAGLTWGRGQCGLPRTALHGLAVEDLDGAPGPGVDLVVHHVLQPLVVGGADEDLRRQLPPGEAVVQNLVPQGTGSEPATDGSYADDLIMA